MKRLAALPLPVVVAGAVISFVLFALDRATGVESVFAVALLGLVAAASIGPCSFPVVRGEGRWSPAAGGAVVCVSLALPLSGAALLVAGVRGGPLGGALAVGLFCGLYAFACGAVAHLLGGGLARIAVAALALALPATLFFWDDLFLAVAEDRKASVDTALSINPAVAAAVTLGYDWIHAKGLYTGNETAESVLGVRLQGVGVYSTRLLAVAIPALLLGGWRKP